MRRVPRIARHAEMRILCRYAERMLMQVRLPDDNRAGGFQAFNHGCVYCAVSNRAYGIFRAAGSLCPREVDDVLHGDGYPTEQTGVFATAHLCLYFPRAPQAFFVKQRDKSVELRFAPSDLRERRLNQFRRRDVAAREFGYGAC